MDKIFRAIKQSVEACTDLRILALLFVPFLLAAVIAVALFFTLGTLGIAMMSGGLEHSWLAQYLTEKWQILSTSAFSSASYVITVVLVILILLPLSYLLAVIVVSIFLMPIILKILDEKTFKNLQKKHGGTIRGNIWNTLKTGSVYFILLLGSLPLWFFPGFAVCVPVLLSAFLNKKIFVYDVLQDYASKEELKLVESRNRRSLYGLGILIGLMNYIPLAFVVMPVFAGLAYSHFCLNALEELRTISPETRR